VPPGIGGRAAHLSGAPGAGRERSVEQAEDEALRSVLAVVLRLALLQRRDERVERGPPQRHAHARPGDAGAPVSVTGMDEVAVVLRKYDGRLHRWVRASRLGEDRHGLWLGTPAGTTVHYNYGCRRAGVTRHDAVRLIPSDRWWIAMFVAAPFEREVYCDICLPARLTAPDELTVIDLDLDLTRFRSGGRVHLEDEDEFAGNAVRYGYAPSVVAEASAAAGDLHRSMTDRTEPFGTAALAWLDVLARQRADRRPDRSIPGSVGADDGPAGTA
jgi:protein associated with RNAse G/E